MINGIKPMHWHKILKQKKKRHHRKILEIYKAKDPAISSTL